MENRESRFVTPIHDVTFSDSRRRSHIRFRLGQSDHLARFLPLPALLEQIDSLKTFQDVALGRDGAGPLETTML